MRLQSGVYLFVGDDLGRATRVGPLGLDTLGVSPSLTAIPRGRVIDLIGTDLVGLEAATDPLPVDAPVAISLVIERASSVADIVDDVVGALARAVIDLFPAWLPGGDHLGESEQLDASAITGLARRLAAGGGHSVAALTMLARAGLAGRRVGHDVPPETLAHECARLLADTYARDHVCLAVSRRPLGTDVDVALPQWTAAEQNTVAAACDWLAQHAGVAVCLVGDPLPDVDRYTPMRWLGPVTDIDANPTIDEEYDATPSTTAIAVRLPALAGQPHPNSVAEQRLHAHLLRQAWATDAQWNMTFAPDPLRAPIRVDVAWTEARCVVEIDGDDHRAAVKYSADRQRDNMLQLAGFTVLRFTNAEVLADVATVAATIQQCLHHAGQQRNSTEGAHRR